MTMCFLSYKSKRSPWNITVEVDNKVDNVTVYLSLQKSFCGFVDFVEFNM